MTWSAVVLDAFHTLKPTDPETHWHTPWHAILDTLFTLEDGFINTLQFQDSPHFDDLEDTDISSSSSTIYVVTTPSQLPVFFVDVKTPELLADNDDRECTDLQIRHTFKRIIDRYMRYSLPIPPLFGISALGTRISIYQYTPERQHIDPPQLFRIRNTWLGDVAPASRWSHSILMPEGEAKFRAVARETRAMVSTAHLTHQRNGVVAPPNPT